MTLKSTSSYRRDIDGLRAIAVLIVVVFHAFPRLVPGGFVGVDVFFVISGFLITGVLRQGVELPYAGIPSFYAHRVRRLFPALLVVGILSLVAGWFFLLPDEYAQLGRHIRAGGLFYENFNLLGEAGYFDVATELKPLMHLWSLSVEEQFYFLFPTVVIVCARWRTSLWRATTVLFVASLAMSAWYAWRAPAQGYFLPQSRFWEILAGAFLKCLVDADAAAGRAGPAPDGRSRQLAAVVGLLLILVSAFAINEQAPFPFPWAMPAVAGSALIIWAGPATLVNRHLLGSRLMVGVGLISYPLYLWHWPLLSFLNIVTSGAHPQWVRLAMLVLAVLLAWATFELVEKPVRRRMPWRYVPLVLAVLMGLLVAQGASVNVRKGMPFRIAARLNSQRGEASREGLWLLDHLNYTAFGCDLGDDPVAHRLRRCMHDTREQPTIALIGDSKSEALAGGLFEATVPGYRLLYLGGTNAEGALVPVLSDAPLYRNYQPFARAALDALAQDRHIRVVIITVATRALFQLRYDSTLAGLPASPNGPMAFDGLSRGVNQLVESGKKVVLTIDNPTLPDPKKCIGRVTGIRWIDQAMNGESPTGCTVTLATQRRLSQPYLDVLHKIQAQHPRQVALFDPLPILCDTTKGTCNTFKNGRLLYAYTDHISDYASTQVSAALIPFVEAFDRQAAPVTPVTPVVAPAAASGGGR